MFISKELFVDSLKPYNITLSDEKIEMFDKYASLLVEWNAKFNLTAIKDPDGIVVKHFVDSLAVLSENQIEGTLIDVGTGAGFPGLPLLIANDNLDVTFLDSTGKKIKFIETVLDELGLFADTVNARAEEAARDEFLRESFDFATARAVSNLRDLSEYCLPFVKVGGKFISMKSAKTEEEITDAKEAIKVLGGEIEKINSFELADCGERTLIFIKKVRPTPTKYPRNYSQIIKNPIVSRGTK
ncbi:MAG: 16S rRNA (guanine(527)-N(7))-methyltransferase RsmG [Ruminococcaceae bacterium]|nr:16S rRNA (guanine(527)-N(7))-methyltransferase RsmG [Oscillospiraceae bacterium]